uniref:Uncharacterized protein n=1 Tax=Utricularia reniformis TaxID=192314 RepID=A0A1Y0B0H3_9LAMI|nr:hypothetical protein AEK19_MT0694 [Utricularia reniformis]ART30942.1 hypothetical protein AEK19_MT0694 [Utricularia reniformis]
MHWQTKIRYPSLIRKQFIFLWFRDLICLGCLAPLPPFLGPLIVKFQKSDNYHTLYLCVSISVESTLSVRSIII